MKTQLIAAIAVATLLIGPGVAFARSEGGGGSANNGGVSITDGDEYGDQGDSGPDMGYAMTRCAHVLRAPGHYSRSEVIFCRSLPAR